MPTTSEMKRQFVVRWYTLALTYADIGVSKM